MTRRLRTTTRWKQDGTPTRQTLAAVALEMLDFMREHGPWMAEAYGRSIANASYMPALRDVVVTHAQRFEAKGHHALGREWRSLDRALGRGIARGLAEQTKEGQ